MRRRVVGVLLAVVLAVTGCADAPEPGDLAAFCSLLERDVGLQTTSSEAEYAQLALVAPPEIRPTIESLQTQARDFDELLNVEPPDLAALFTAKFDPAAAGDRAELDRFAVETCDLTVDRPPSTRWANYVRENHVDAPWRDDVSASFQLAGDRVVAMDLTFEEAPAQMEDLVEGVCEAASQFLIVDGSGDAEVRVLLGSVVVLQYDDTDGACRLP